jgi:hypothetical protein
MIGVHLLERSVDIPPTVSEQIAIVTAKDKIVSCMLRISMALPEQTVILNMFKFQQSNNSTSKLIYFVRDKAPRRKQIRKEAIPPR